MDLIDRAIFIQKGKIVQIFLRKGFHNLSDEQRIRMGLRRLVHPVLDLPPADPPGAQEGLSVENLFAVLLISSRYSAVLAFLQNGAKCRELSVITAQEKRR